MKLFDIFITIEYIFNIHTISLGPPQNFAVNQNETEDGKLLTNISWTPQDKDLKYYLHINTSDGKQLYMIDKQVQLINVYTCGMEDILLLRDLT